MPSYRVAPSLLSGDFARLGEECVRMMDFGADWLHLDVMDGHFVPNLTIGPPVVQCIRKAVPEAFLDCHLMVSTPEKWIADFANSGASQITFHYEATSEPLRMTAEIKRMGIKAAMAIKPHTTVESIPKEIFDALDMVLVMTVEPGFGGQKLIPSCLSKVRGLRQRYPSLDIQVDGGITLENLDDAIKSGANVVVAGSLIFGSSDPKRTISDMREIIERTVTEQGLNRA